MNHIGDSTTALKPKNPIINAIGEMWPVLLFPL